MSCNICNTGASSSRSTPAIADGLGITDDGTIEARTASLPALDPAPVSGRKCWIVLALILLFVYAIFFDKFGK